MDRLVHAILERYSTDGIVGELFIAGLLTLFGAISRINQPRQIFGRLAAEIMNWLLRVALSLAVVGLVVIVETVASGNEFLALKLTYWFIDYIALMVALYLVKPSLVAIIEKTTYEAAVAWKDASMILLPLSASVIATFTILILVSARI